MDVRERVRIGLVAVAMVAAMAGGAPRSTQAAAPRPAACDMTAASRWIQEWLAAWELTSREILGLPDVPAPGLVFFDSLCVFSTLPVAAPGAKAQKGPSLRGESLRWYATPHGDTLRLPTRRQEVTLLSFTDNDPRHGPYFVMAAPSYWASRVGATAAQPGGMTGVFLHEFTHTRQMAGVGKIIGPIDKSWKFEKELDDDAVQHRFGKDSVYVASYLEERDRFWLAAAAGPRDSVRLLAAEALAMMRARREKYFTGDDAVFATLDDLWLSMEGAAQWTAAAWLAHPKGGGLTRDAAITRMLGRRRWWSQDESLAIFLVVDRLLAGWPKLVFRDPSAGVLELLEKATKE